MITRQPFQDLRLTQLWQLPPAHLTLGTEEVHVWRAHLAVRPQIVESLRELLSDDEKARADRFHFERDRGRFIVARSYLRSLLGQYLDVRPAEVKLVYEKYGKPTLARSTPQAHRLYFNLAHSGVLALYAFTRLGAIGVDVELIRRHFSDGDIAHRYFSVSEVASLLSLPKEVRPAAFFKCWTRKEAFIKAKGMGLSLPLDQFDVTLTPGESAALLRTRWDEGEAARWSLKELDAGLGYEAAVALESHDWHLRHWQVEPDTCSR